MAGFSWDDFSSPVDPAAPATPAAPPVNWDAISTPYAEPPIALQPGERPLTVFHPPTVSESAVRGARSGATFNWGDELAGLAAASPIPGKTDQPDINAIDVLAGAARLGFDKLTGSTEGEQKRAAMVERERALNEAAKKENPNAYFMGELGGGVATAVLAPEIKAFQPAAPVLQTGKPIANLAARGVSYIPTVGNRAVTGAAFGGASGAGGAEGDIGDRLAGAGAGALEGAVLAPVIGGGIDTLGGAGRTIANQYRALTDPESIATKVVARAAHEDQANLPQIAQQVQAANRPGVPANVTTQQLQALADRAGVPLETVLDRIAQKTGAVRQPLTWADIGGPGIRGVAGQVLRNPGEQRLPAQRFVNERQKGVDAFAPGPDSQGGRVDAAIGNIIGHEGLRKTTKALMDRRRANADPLYTVAHSKPINYDNKSGQILQDILENSISSSEKKLANTLLRRDNQGGLQLIWRQNNKGEFELVSLPNTRQWDYIQQALQDAVDNGRDKFGQLSTSARSALSLKERIIEQLEENNSALKAARKVYAGDSAMLDAVREGGKIWDRGYSREQLAEKLKSMTDAEKEMFRIGASNSLRELKMGEMGAGENKVRAIFGNRNRALKARMIAPDQRSFDALRAFLGNEQKMHETYSLQGGSPTEPRLQEAAHTEALVGAGRLAASAAAGHMRAFVYEAFRHLGRISPERRSAVMEAVRKVILNPDAEAIRAFTDKVNASTSPSLARQYISTVLKALPRTIVNDATQNRQATQ
jgi:hypothetical protein